MRLKIVVEIIVNETLVLLHIVADVSIKDIVIYKRSSWFDYYWYVSH